MPMAIMDAECKIWCLWELFWMLQLVFSIVKLCWQCFSSTFHKTDCTMKMGEKRVMLKKKTPQHCWHSVLPLLEKLDGWGLSGNEEYFSVGTCMRNLINWSFTRMTVCLLISGWDCLSVLTHCLCLLYARLDQKKKKEAIQFATGS